MGTIVTLADAIVQELNSTSFTMAFTATRGYLPRRELEEMDTLRVTVVPRAATRGLHTRAEHLLELTVDIAIQKKLAAESNAEIDGLVDLVEEVSDFISGRDLQTFNDAVWTETRHEVLFSEEHMDKLRLFTSVLSLTYQVTA